MPIRQSKCFDLSNLILPGIVFVLAVGNCGVCAQNKTNDVPPIIKESRLTDRRAALREEIGELSRFLAVHPQNAAVYGMRAARFAELKEYRAAIADYSRLIRLKPAALRHRLERASCYQELAQYAQALADLNYILKRTSRNNDTTGDEAYSALYSRYLIFSKIEDYEKAVDALTEILKFRPTDESIYQSRSELYKRMKEYAKAIDDYTRLIEINPRSTWGYLGRAEVYRILGETHEADADTKAADLITKKRSY